MVAAVGPFVCCSLGTLPVLSGFLGPAFGTILFSAAARGDEKADDRDDAEFTPPHPPAAWGARDPASLARSAKES